MVVDGTCGVNDSKNERITWLRLDTGIFNPQWMVLPKGIKAGGQLSSFQWVATYTNLQ
ncbi:hypothetical protein PtA15_15A200 [Puccinia triticina]|uniref:Uncharacterized protein n=1 Tax=Puccinia triticina TaxID=208348 RepID=A0ABY7D2G3_9BASI|nr:uncharacterized protein PtA15_15A200 [Puccinia triticina]WAQ91808.1 hypothetical protein PtA15_15A200 [Puccinia triticina]